MIKLKLEHILEMKKFIKIGCYAFIAIFIAIFSFIFIAMLGESNLEDDLGAGYVWNQDTQSIFGPVDIPNNIIKFAFDDNYIVASQKWNMTPMDMYDLGYYDDVPFSQYDSDGDGVVYWIVNKNTNRNIPCGNIKEFLELCDSLGVSGDLVAGITY